MKSHLTMLSLGLLLSFNVCALPIATPVIDAAALVKLGNQLSQLKKQYDMMSRTYTNAKYQLDTAKSQLNSIQDIKKYNSGHYGFGDLKNHIDDLVDRQWSSNTWDEALQAISGGNPARYQALVNSYKKNNPILADEIFQKGSTSEQLKQYKRGYSINETVNVQTTYIFNNVNKHLKAIHTLSSQIEKSQNTKSSIDLNTRLLAEVAYIQTETLKLQTLISQQAAWFGEENLISQKEMAAFNRLPDE